MRYLILMMALVGLESQGVDIAIMDREERVFDCAGRLETNVTRQQEPSGIETVKVEAKSLVDEPIHVKIVVRTDVPGATTIWDGRDEMKKPTEVKSASIVSGDHRFLLGAAWNAEKGVALALGAEDAPSFADLAFAPMPDGVSLALTVPAAFLRRNARFVCTFHRLGFSPKYGIRDALARYYPLYPARFKRDPRVNPAIYGTCAQYAAWQRSDPETCRFMGATWEWCYAAARTWGDILSREEPVGAQNTRYCWSSNNNYFDRTGRYHKVVTQEETRDSFLAIQRGKLANGRYCGVANAFYMMALADISNAIAERYPDSFVADHPCIETAYPYATEIFTFPECSWGKALRAQLAELTAREDLGGIAFDVSRPVTVYRGERLREMDNVGWDAYGAGVVRGVGSAKLFDYVRTLPNKAIAGNCGVVVNTKGSHVSDMLHADTMMMELPPWSREPPYPLNLRFMLGEKGLTFWEDYSPLAFASDYAKWSREDRQNLIRDLARCAVHRSLATGATLPCAYMTEYVALAARALAILNAEGWKPVLGAAAEGEHWELARYGLGERSYLAVCNETNAARRVALTVWPDEIANGIVGGDAAKADGILFAPFWGGEAEMACGGDAQRVSCEVGPLLVNVLETAGTLRGKGRLAARWSGDFDAVCLTVKATDFNGEVDLREQFGTYVREGARTRKIAAGETIEILYRNTQMPGVLAKIRAFPFADTDGKRSFHIEHAADGASKDMADRLEYFFWRAMDTKAKAKAKTIRRNGRKPYVACREKAGLPPRTVVLRGNAKGIEPITLSATDDEAFSHLVRRIIDVLNAERFPSYGPDVTMLPEERAWFSFRRL